MGQVRETARLDYSHGLATITLTRPQQGNALGAQAGRDLRALALACRSHPDVRAVVLRAEGRSFCVGGDINDFSASEDLGAAVKDMVIDFHAAVSMLARMPAPLVVAVQGAAAGAGLSLVCLADIAVAARSATFTVAYTGIGFSSDGGLSYTMPRLVGLRRFQSLALTNRSVSASEAVDIGLITEVVDDDALDAHVDAVARKLAHGPTRAYAAMRRLALDSYGRSLEGQLEQEAIEVSALASSSDSQRAIAAIVAKQRPTFEGR
jgi:2-(1,2-epoxy-1,2-dihydrophenyl)acetyl-CoA isomerase